MQNNKRSKDKMLEKNINSLNSNSNNINNLN